MHFPIGCSEKPYKCEDRDLNFPKINNFKNHFRTSTNKNP